MNELDAKQLLLRLTISGAFAEDREESSQSVEREREVFIIVPTKLDLVRERERGGEREGNG